MAVFLRFQSKNPSISGHGNESVSLLQVSEKGQLRLALKSGLGRQELLIAGGPAVAVNSAWPQRADPLPSEFTCCS